MIEVKIELLETPSMHPAINNRGGKITKYIIIDGRVSYT